MDLGQKMAGTLKKGYFQKAVASTHHWYVIYTSFYAEFNGATSFANFTGYSLIYGLFVIVKSSDSLTPFQWR
jgi:ubiquitin C-terminal hydrolase